MQLGEGDVVGLEVSGRPITAGDRVAEHNEHIPGVGFHHLHQTL